MRCLIVLCLLTFFYHVSAYKILGIFQHSGKSHFDVFEPMFKELSRRGHQVTMISHFPQTEKIPNYKDVSLRGTAEILVNVIPIGFFGNSIWTKLRHVVDLALFTGHVCDILNSKQMQDFITNKDKFDIVITEHFTHNCFLGLMQNTGGALIGVTSGGLVPWANDYVGNPDNPAYIPILFSGMSDNMSFGQRVENTLGYVIGKVAYKLLIDVPANWKARQFIDPNLPALNTFAYNTSMILANVHCTLHRAKPLVPSIVEVGGMHVGKAKNLPKNIEKWINESKDGVVYFSMGSMIIGHSFPEDKRRMFQNAFSKLKQRVLWKWENDTMPGKPNNVMIQKWMPQLDILCHPNVKAFVGHAGLLGTTEAVHCGVPAVLMPQYGDQFVNAKGLEAGGGGVILDFGTITEESILKALKTVLEPSFKKQAEELSARFKDRPMSPLDTAIYWIEYVARHKGAPHLRTAAVGMPFYQYLLLDVIGFVLAVSVVSYLVLAHILKFVFGKICGSKAKTKKVKKS